MCGVHQVSLRGSYTSPEEAASLIDSISAKEVTTVSVGGGTGVWVGEGHWSVGVGTGVWAGHWCVGGGCCDCGHEHL